MSAHAYQPLDPDRNEIRMLEIHPSRRSSSTLKCSLINFNLDDLDDDGTTTPFRFYEALSYTWGDPTGKVAIQLDGHAFEVTRNLAAALRRLRARKGYRYLWVDALCINQADEAERGSQVARMGLIYRQAEQVLIWLGPHADGSKGAMQLVARVSELGVDEDDVAASLADAAHRARWEAVARLFDRPYWRRLWVRQEIALARAIWVLCGDALMSWDALIEGAAFLYDHAADFDPIAAGLSHFTSGYMDANGVDIMCEGIRSGGLLALDDVLLSLRGCECTDLRDKVYGGLSLCDGDSRIPVDYGLDRVEVFTRAAIAAITSTGSLDIVCSCQNPERTSGLPSWVPDLGVDWMARKFRRTENAKALGSAGGFTSSAYTIQRLDSGSFSLTARGVVLDCLSEVCSAYTDDATLFEVLEEWRISAIKTLTSVNVVLSADQIRSAFFRTIVANEELHGLEASDTFIAQALEHAVDGTLQYVIPVIDLRYGDTEFSRRFRDDAANRRFFTTEKGYIGLGPVECRKADLVVVLLGLALPLVLRKENNHYVVVGEAYVHGIMNEEVSLMLSNSILEVEDFEIH
ncbi:HET-domain-containing protein [Xylariaceae sp. FL0016]|nr:HET-domain-containing protein [Xylariaceae sp. FL0016]